MARTTEEALVLGLTDAGCGADAARRLAELYARRQTGELLRLLSDHRRGLLEALHENQQQLDTLDYLIFNLRKEEHT